MPGYKLDESSCDCDACEQQTYQPDWGQDTCMPCPARYEEDSQAAVQCGGEIKT